VSEWCCSRGETGSSEEGDGKQRGRKLLAMLLHLEQGGSHWCCGIRIGIMSLFANASRIHCQAYVQQRRFEVAIKINL
jgi:hypothetical protein